MDCFPIRRKRYQRGETSAKVQLFDRVGMQYHELERMITKSFRNQRLMVFQTGDINIIVRNRLRSICLTEWGDNLIEILRWRHELVFFQQVERLNVSDCPGMTINVAINSSQPVVGQVVDEEGAFYAFISMVLVVTSHRIVFTDQQELLGIHFRSCWSGN